MVLHHGGRHPDMPKRLEITRTVYTPENKRTFVVINQKGMDLLSLDAKRRNVERLVLAWDRMTTDSAELGPLCLGEASLVYGHALGDNKFTFVEQCTSPLSVTILMKGPNKHTLVMQVKVAVRDELKAVKDAAEDGCVIPGAEAYGVVCHVALECYLETVKGKARRPPGTQLWARALQGRCSRSG